MKVVLSPWFYGSCARYLKKPEIPTEDDIKQIYAQIGGQRQTQRFQAEELFYRHLDCFKAIQKSRVEVYLIEYKNICQSLGSLFPDEPGTANLQETFLLHILYYINKLIEKRKYQTAFSICHETQPLFKQGLFKLKSEKLKAYQAQFISLMAVIFKK